MITMVPLKQLHDGGAINSRKAAPDQLEIDGLANSIRQLGLILPLSVVKNGKGYKVIDGNRRLMALQLVHEGEKGVEIPVLVQETDDTTALAMSVAANIERLPLHEVDQYEAFEAMAAKGKPLDEIASAFGVSERTVQQRMALGGLHEVARQAFRDGGIDLRFAKLLTRIPPDDQLKLLLSGEPAWKMQQSIIESTSSQSIDPTSSMALFVSRETYLDNGGQLVRDLFAEEGKEKWVDVNMALALANEKIIRLKREAYAEGWSFFEQSDQWIGQDYSVEDPAGFTAQDLAQLDSIRGRLDEIAREADENEGYTDSQREEIDLLERKEAEIHDNIQYTDEQKARTGVVLDVHYQLHYGATRRRGSAAAKQEPAPKDEAQQSSAVMMELDAYLTRAVHGALVDNPMTAMRFMVLTFLSDYYLFEKMPNLYGGLGIRADFSGKVLPAYDYGFDAVEEIVKACGLLKAKTFDAKMKAVMKLTDHEVTIILGFIIGRSIQTRHRGNDLVLYLDRTDALNIRQHFTPTVDNFFGRLNKRQLILVLDEAGINEKGVDVEAMKKAELAAYVAKVLPADWIPEAMRPKKIKAD